MTTRRGFLLLAALLGPVVSGCQSPEDGRPRGGDHGGDGGNYVRGQVHPPSKIDASKDLSVIDHYGPASRSAPE